jgi:hypothetical protein
MTPEQEIIRAGEARQILEATLFVEARKHIEGQLAYLRSTVPISATEMHTRLILMEQLWAMLTGFLEQVMVSGRMAQMTLEQQRQQQSLLERGIAMFRTGGRGRL